MLKETGDLQEIMLKVCGEYLQQDKPQDYVIAMNETHTVREFVELAFAEVRI